MSSIHSHVLSAGLMSTAASRLLPNVFLHPGKYHFVPALAIERSENPMSFVGEDQTFGRHAISAKCGEKLEALIDGHAKILLVGDNQRRSFDSFRKQMRRAPRKMTPGHLAPWR